MAKNKRSEITASESHLIPSEYKKLLEELKTRIRASQIKAAVKVNEELIKLYWEIGQEIVGRQEKEEWGTQVLERLSHDLQNAFPGVGGFSRTNVFRMRAFYLAYQKVPQPVGQLEDLPIFRIPWGHNAIIIEKLGTIEQRLWYAEQTLINGWSRGTLEDWIKSDLYSRKGKAVTNFTARLPEAHSALAQETTKNPYNFQFLTLREKYVEEELERRLIDHIQHFLLELGQGFAFIGSQYPLEVSGKDYYLDLLFYHIGLRCFVVIELLCCRQHNSSTTMYQRDFL